MVKEATASSISGALEELSDQILADWTKELISSPMRSGSVSDDSLKSTAAEFLKLFKEAAKKSNFSTLSSSEWEPLKQMLSQLSASRAAQGSTPTETAAFVLSLRQTLLSKISSKFGAAEALGPSVVGVWSLIDQLGLYTTEVFQRSREAIIRRQQKEMLEMSTPVIKLWEGILVVPLIGTLDSARTQIVMENLLQRIVDTGSQIAILDITGVPTVDTQTAQHLMKTVSATRLMGADCIISGIRPQIAQTIVHLGIDIYDISTKATMGDAVKEALKRIGWSLKQDVENRD